MTPDRNDDLNGAWCVVNDLWPDLVVDVERRDGQVSIVIDAELMQQVRAGRHPSVLEGRSRTYRAKTWQEAVRAAGNGEGVKAAKIEDRITTVERAEREGLSVFFAPMDE